MSEVLQSQNNPELLQPPTISEVAGPFTLPYDAVKFEKQMRVVAIIVAGGLALFASVKGVEDIKKDFTDKPPVTATQK